MRSGSPALQSVEIRDWTSCSFSAPGRPPIEAGSHGRPACSPTRSPCPGSLLQRTATTTVSLTDQEASLAQLRHDTPPDISEARSDIRPPGQQPQAPPALAIYDEPTPLASAARRARRRGPQRAARGPPRRAHCRRNACSAPTPPSARSRTRCSAPAPLHALGGAAELVTRRVLHCPSPSRLVAFAGSPARPADAPQERDQSHVPRAVRRLLPGAARGALSAGELRSARARPARPDACGPAAHRRGALRPTPRAVEQLDRLDVRHVLARAAPPFEFDQRRAREHRDADIAELVVLAVGDEPFPLGQAG
jgi:hypothetical protein